MKKLFSILLICLIFLNFAACQKEENQVAENKDYATVNGETITVSEIEYFKTRDRTDIINEFSEKYKITDYSDFWNKEFDGVTPASALEERAFDDAVTAKIKLVLMREQGIYDDIGFEALKNKAEKYNESHKNQSGTVGITSIDLDSFYTYYIDTGEMELKNRLAESELKPAQVEIDEYLSSNSDLTEEGAISFIVNESYKDYLNSLVEKAEIQKLK